ncbi:MAG: TIGR00269 family protein [Candidatus Bathyarchaeota archaeon]|nr:TIGR00269 family protein [Candidatus Bathyarchaeota archaeon]
MAAPLCTKCRAKPSVYLRPYSGERLCRSCFAASIRERVERAISRFDMLEFDSRIALGVSGGKDSINLLHLLAKIEEKFPRAELIAVSIDEGVGGYRDEALRFAKGACRLLGIEHLILSFRELFGLTMDDISEKTEGGELTTCSYCGVLRRRALNKAAAEVEADRLATAHNLDDMAQTALLNIMRGDLRRLAAMSPGGSDIRGFVRRVKPFCDVPERESTLYAYLRGVEFQSIPCPYAEEAMRTDIRRFINRMEVKRPGTKFIIYRTALSLIPESHGKATEPASLCRICGEPTREKVCRTCRLIGELS